MMFPENYVQFDDTPPTRLVEFVDEYGRKFYTSNYKLQANGEYMLVIDGKSYFVKPNNLYFYGRTNN